MVSLAICIAIALALRQLAINSKAYEIEKR